jgi:Glycosyl transferase family 2
MVNEKTQITVVIATSFYRTKWLTNRSLKSVYNQKNIPKNKCSVLVVDDNKDENEFYNVKEQIRIQREKLKLTEDEFPIEVIRNNRTRFMSGTGAWNTGIFLAYNTNPDILISILDDDDEYLPHHLADCMDAIDNETIAVFQWLIWENKDNTLMHLPFKFQDLIAENFFKGNPGVQGSNMFFKAKYIFEINGFDEHLPNTTDRDLMIRFLWHFTTLQQSSKLKIKVIEKVGVKHYNHRKEKVNNNLLKKQEGLDLFYQKYKPFFSEITYKTSLIRAKQFFNYIPVEER